MKSLSVEKMATLEGGNACTTSQNLLRFASRSGSFSMYLYAMLMVQINCRGGGIDSTNPK